MRQKEVWHFNRMGASLVSLSLKTGAIPMMVAAIWDRYEVAVAPKKKKEE